MSTERILNDHDRAVDVGVAASTCPVACERHLGGELDGLLCIHPHGHPGPHQFESTSVADAHDASEEAAERRRG